VKRVVSAAAALLCLAACSTDTVSAPSSPITPGGSISGWAAPTDSTVVAVDAVTGRIRWQTKTPTRSVAFGGVGGGTVIISGFSDCHGSTVIAAVVVVGVLLLAGVSAVRWKLTSRGGGRHSAAPGAASSTAANSAAGAAAEDDNGARNLVSTGLRG
jgi:hypothetical protein